MPLTPLQFRSNAQPVVLGITESITFMEEQLESLGDLPQAGAMDSTVVLLVSKLLRIRSADPSVLEAMGYETVTQNLLGLLTHFLEAETPRRPVESNEGGHTVLLKKRAA